MVTDKGLFHFSVNMLGRNNFNYAKIEFNLEKRKYLCHKINKNKHLMLDTGYYTSEALTLLHSLIGIPSISREEEAAADFLQNYIEETGIMTGR